LLHSLADGEALICSKTVIREITMDSETTIKKAGCFFCHNNCGVLVHIKEGKVVKVQGILNIPVAGVSFARGV
jgi:anaerobic selenocysteine-containing dehydrogenase